MKHNKDDLFSRGCNFYFRCIAYFLLQPMFISSKREIKPGTIARLKKYLPVLSETAIKCGQFFKNFERYCNACSGTCCRGQHDRFTIYDHITDIVRGGEQYRNWGNYLMPLRSRNLERSEINNNCTYLGPNGCKLPYPERPSHCIYGTCGIIRQVITKDQKKELRDLRRKFNKVRFMFTISLLLGGTKSMKDDTKRSKQNVFIGNKNVASPKALAKHS